MPQCKDCGKQIDKRAMRCWSCAAKARRVRGDYDDPETRLKLSVGTKARWVRGDFDGVFDNSETRRKMPHCKDCGVQISGRATRCGSCAMKARRARGDYDNPEIRRKFSEGMKARWARGDFDGIFDNPETRRKMAETTKASWVRGDFDSPETKRKRAESAKAARARGDYDSPETRRKLSESKKAHWQDPEYRQSHCGENNSNWQGGTSFELYGLDWTDKLREEIRERDEHICAISGEVWQLGEVKFDVHHVNYCKTDNGSENLITLCHSCHAKTNSNRRHWQALLAHVAKGAEMRANAFVGGP